MGIFKEGALCFDIGAHTGESAEKFSGAGAGKVISLEPCIENFSGLASRIADKKLPAVPIHAAAWSKVCKLEARLAANQTGLSTLVPDKWSIIYDSAGFQPPQPVWCLTLDALAIVFGRPDYIKVDVEGAELEVLQGLSDEWKPAVLTFEFHGKFAEDAVKCMEWCEAHGYTKATLIEADVDLNVMPEKPIRELRDEFERSPVQWGNITVA